MKLDIIGSVASGKTTLAAKLAKKYNVPHYQKDNIVWERTAHGDVRRSDKERDQIFRTIIDGEQWIVEGSPRKDLNESMECCDYIILLDIPFWTRFGRVFMRWLRQRTGKEDFNTKPTLRFLWWNIKWVLEYSRDRKKIIAALAGYGERLRIFHNSQSAEKFIEKTYRQGR